MIEPVALEQFFLGVVSSAMVVLMGALYALLFALGRLSRDKRLLLGAYAAYAALFVSTMWLAEALNLDGFWQIVVVVMLIGYLLAPQAIWHLCVGTHVSSTSGGGDSAKLVGRSCK